MEFNLQLLFWLLMRILNISRVFGKDVIINVVYLSILISFYLN